MHVRRGVVHRLSSLCGRSLIAAVRGSRDRQPTDARVVTPVLRSERCLRLTRLWLCVGVSLGATIAPPAGAQTWLPATPLSAPATAPTGVAEVAMDRVGNAVAVWARVDGSAPGCCTIVQGSTRPVGGTWRPATTLSTPGRNAETPHAAFAAGRGLVVWVEPGVSSKVVRHRTVTPGGFGPMASLSVSETGRDASAPQVALNDAGAAVVVWSRPNGIGTAIQAATRDSAGAGFSLPEQVSLTESGASDEQPRVAINAAGQAMTIWRSTTDAGSQIQTAGRPRLGQDWVFAQVYERGSDPDIAVRPDGTVIAVWLDGNSPEYKPGSLTRFQPYPADAFDGGGFARPPIRVVAAEGGVDLAIWRAPLLNGDVVRSAIRAMGNFAPSRIVSPVGSIVRDVQLTGTPGTNTLAAWRRGVSSWGAVARPSGGDWGNVIEPPTLGGTLAADIDDQGTVLALSEVDNRVSATVRDVGPPSLTAVSVPQQVEAGQPATMAASAGDRWSGAGLTWNFGDGHGATGPTVAHAYATPGVYDVTVTARDGAGNARSETHAIQVVTLPPPDRDGDGYNAKLDCDDGNPLIHQGAVDTPRNGLDEDCEGGDADYPLLGSRVLATFAPRRGYDVVRGLWLQPAHAGSTVRVRCTGSRCTFKPRTLKVRRDASRLSLRRLARGLKLRRQMVLEVSVTHPAKVGTRTSWSFKSLANPRRKDRCQWPGERSARRCPQ